MKRPKTIGFERQRPTTRARPRSTRRGPQTDPPRKRSGTRERGENGASSIAFARSQHETPTDALHANINTSTQTRPASRARV